MLKTSRNRGNFLEIIKLLSQYNSNVAGNVLKHAPGNAKSTIEEDYELLHQKFQKLLV